MCSRHYGRRSGDVARLASLLVALAVGLGLPASSGSGTAVAKPAGKAAEPWDAARAAEEYRAVGLELALARTGNPYMVIDVGRKDISLRVKAAVVWNSHLELASSDSEALADFADRFTHGGRRPLRFMTSKYLFAAREKTPDSILAIVGKVVKTDPELLQRDIPERFELKWGPSLILDVHTDAVGAPKSRFRNAEVSVLEAIRRPFGQCRLRVSLGADDGLTLYRAASPRLPTLVLLPS
jgi:hypothetical protein